MGRILFNSYTPEWAWLSNFSPHPVGIWPTAEHAYQAAKTVVPEERKRIRSAPTPKAAKALSYKITRRACWDEPFKHGVMLGILWMKAHQHPELKAKLLATGDAELIHHAPWGDRYWGEDNDGVGFNWQGRLWMQIREELRGHEGRAPREAAEEAEVCSHQAS